MPKQFIKVKNNSDVIPSVMTPDKQECTKCESSSNISNSNGDICRICHCEADQDNPLLSPCYCSGSLKYVHQSCLRQWLAASDTRSCELCKFNFILHTKIKPLSEWRRLEMSGVERRRLLCAILFHFVAAICVIWSLFVLIDRAAEEVQKGLIAWPFWTKLVVVAVGFTGGAVFMYIQCRQYLHLFSRWKAYNRIILVQNAPEKPTPMPPSTSFTYDQDMVLQFPSQIQAHVEYNVPSAYAENSRNDLHLCYTFEKQDTIEKEKMEENSSSSSVYKDDIQIEDLCEKSPVKCKSGGRDLSWSDPRMKDREILALDIQCPSAGPNLDYHKTEITMKKSNSVFISLPNLNASSENLLV
ncbi:hypothetical protein WA026_000888 [Henosepilachna vigintioctopunctata]|uniref:E3 ubiquitin-protein ligase MARCH8 n=1 Tax=Henosepilachna vigintioctopunctata TaxID=420089 RepID=A0AAW1V9T9_9CUCU